MSESIIAIYEGGVLRLPRPLPLPEGTPVRVTVTEEANGSELHARHSLADKAAQARRREALAFVQSLRDAKDSDDLPEGYDFLDALNANRGPGQRPLFPPDLKGVTW
jgi:predicted DNA-binding antitoxin AbrB/MazE fold protein